jgi:hypothetical protein
VQEYIELCTRLFYEWQPSGPTEEDAVLSLAGLMWRKLRAERLLRAKLTFSNSWEPGSPTFDERLGFEVFIGCLRSEPETAFEKQAGHLLRAAMINRLKQKFPRSNYQSTSEWAEAVIMEIKSVLLPNASPGVEATEPGERDLIVEWKVAASIMR